MKNAMFVGLAVGMAAGAYLAGNCPKVRQVVTGAQEQIKSKFCPQKQNDWQEDTNNQNETNDTF